MKARRQVGVVAVRAAADGGVEVLLVTSRGSGRWGVPKGWPMRGRRDSAAAAREALEEAGVTGDVGDTPVGAYTYHKARKPGAPIEVALYRLDVTNERQRYRERGQRTVRWFAPAEAAARVASPELARAIEAVAAQLSPGQSAFDAWSATDSWWRRLVRAIREP